MYHSITFYYTDPVTGKEISRNTWKDWHLVSEERPSFQPPKERTSFVTIPGASGSLDTSEVLTGYPLYERRTGSWEFIIVNEIAYGNQGKEKFVDWTTTYEYIANFLHNKEMYAILDDDIGYKYIGRFYMNKWKSDKNWSTITIDYDVHPFKKEINSVDSDWLWDPFDFEKGEILDNEFRNIWIANGGTTVKFEKRHIGEEPICPIFKITRISPAIGSGANVVEAHYANKELGITDYQFTLVKGSNRFPEIILTQGGCTFEFYGDADLTISFTRGKL